MTAATDPSKKPDPLEPKSSAWLFRWFQGYSRRYVRKHFHGARLSRSGACFPNDVDKPLIVVLNHPSWWDVITCFLLSTLLPRHRHYAPIDSAMLRKYRFFARLGLFGVDPTPRGAAVFLRTCTAIFTRPGGCVWVTGQGRFADARERPIRLRGGVGAVASRLERGVIVPVAVEYVFWNERTPELLMRIGNPIDLTVDRAASSGEWTARIEAGLTETMDVLAAESLARDPTAFTTLIDGRVGVGGPYDWMRRFGAWIRGRRSELAHDRSPTTIPGKSTGSATATVASASSIPSLASPASPSTEVMARPEGTS